MSASPLPESIGIQRHLTALDFDKWLQNEVFHTQWWLLVGFVLLLALLWFRLLDGAKARQVCLFAMMAVILILAVDEYGEETLLWEYPIDILPVFPPLSSTNIFIWPVLYSLLYQYFGTWKAFVVAVLAATAVLCFAVEPGLSWAGYYHLLNWQYYFSFPAYVLLALLLKLLTDKSFEIMERNRRAAG